MVSLQSHEGRYMTKEEIELSKYYKNRKEEAQRQRAEAETTKLKRALQVSQGLVSTMSTSLSGSGGTSSGGTSKLGRVPAPPIPDKAPMVEEAAPTQTISSSGSARHRPYARDSDDSSDDDDERSQRKKRARQMTSTTLDPALYPSSGMLHMDETLDLSNKLNVQALEWTLPDFGYDQNQTLAIKMTIPTTGRQCWAVNLAAAGDDSLLLHFNARGSTEKYHEVVLNDRNGKDVWGSYIPKTLDTLPPLFGCSLDFCLQVRKEGLCVYVNGKFATAFMHRDVYESHGKSSTSLKLQIPIRDDRKVPYNAKIHAVWWGRLEHIDDAVVEEMGELQGSQPTNIKSARTVNITGVPVFKKEQDKIDFQSYLFALFEGDDGEDSYRPEDVRVFEKGATVVFATRELAIAAIRDHNNAEIEGEDGTTANLFMSFPRTM